MPALWGRQPVPLATRVGPSVAFSKCSEEHIATRCVGIIPTLKMRKPETGTHPVSPGKSGRCRTGRGRGTVLASPPLLALKCSVFS